VPDGERRTAAGVAVELGERDRVVADAVEEAWAVLTASWPIIASTTKRISSGCVASRISRACCIISASTPRRPAVSITTTS